MFGHIKNIYLRKKKDSVNIWLRASTAMYLLPGLTVANDYLPKLIEFFREQGMREKHYKNLLARIITAQENSMERLAL